MSRESSNVRASIIPEMEIETANNSPLESKRNSDIPTHTHSHIKISRYLTGGELSCIHIHTNPHIHTILTHIQIQQGTHTTGWFSRTVAYTYVFYTHTYENTHTYRLTHTCLLHFWSVTVRELSYVRAGRAVPWTQAEMAHRDSRTEEDTEHSG